MRLKYLFFPMILVLAIAVFFGYIRPEVDTFQGVRTEYDSKKQLLESVHVKKTALQNLSSKIKSDDQDKTAILNYLPSDKAEERIIGDVNYMAANSGVFLDNVKIVSQDSGSNQNSQSSQQSSSADGFSPVTDPNVAAQPADTVQNTQAVISVNGDYDKLKMFFKGIQHMPLYNSIESLKINSIEKLQSDPALPPSTVITADLTVNFGYLKQVKADSKKLAEFNAQIDGDAVKIFRDYISDRIPVVNVSEISAGRSNPFLP